MVQQGDTRTASPRRAEPAFLFGAGTAGHQVEGGNVNSDWWQLEHSGLESEPSGDAIDHYHRYQEDLALLGSLGFNAYRMSLEWSRIEPAPGLYSRAAIAHYRRVLQTCRAQHLTPIVTLHHFSSPAWLTRDGGWEAPATAARFAAYVEFVAEHLGDLLGQVCTFNEVNMPQLIALDGAISDFELDRYPVRAFPYCDPVRCNPVVMDGHRRAVATLRARWPHVRAGFTIHMHGYRADEGAESSVARYRAAAEDEFLRQAVDDDFIGVQAYGFKYLGPDGPRVYLDEGQPRPRDNRPEALGEAIRHAVAITGKPVLVTENGYAMVDGPAKIDHIARALRAVAACRADGIAVQGYLYWSAFDIYEWQRGFVDRYGLIAVERESQRRIVGATARWLGETAREWQRGRCTTDTPTGMPGR